MAFMLCMAMMALSGSSVFGQARCSNSACEYVSCNEFYSGFVTQPAPNWTVDIRQGPCQPECADGPCFRLHQFALADLHGAGVLVVEDVTPEDVKAIHEFRLHFDAKEPSTMTLQDWQKAISAKFPKHKTSILTGDEFNKRAKEAAKSDCAQ